MKLRYKILSGILGGIVIIVAVGGVALAFAMSRTLPCGAEPSLAPGVSVMKAVVHRCYGSPGVMRYEDLAKPVPADDEVLVRVHAASLNPLDWHYLQGTPYMVRMEEGFGKPKDPRLGVDFAGSIEAVGKQVTRFKLGDEVFGGKFGALAEYVTVRQERALASKPANMTFEQAAAVPIAGITALQALRDKGQLHAGQKVLINGASGGVGTFAVQIAKSLGAEVTGVCSTRNVAMVRSIGADHVIDYTREDFTQGTQRYDVIIDNVGTHSLSEYRRVLNPKGIYVTVGSTTIGNWFGWLEDPLEGMVLSHFVSQRFVTLLADLNPQDLKYLAELMQSGKLKPVIDPSYNKLSEAAEAMRYLEKGHARGKIVLSVQ